MSSRHAPLASLLKSKPILAVLLIGLIFAGMELFSDGAPASIADGQAQQAIPVEVTVIALQPVQLWKDFSGRMVAVDYVELRPQVKGRVTEIRFKDGQQVKEGDVVMVIDPRPYQANHQEAQALLSAAQNQLALSEKELKRAEVLIKTNAISERLLDERLNARNIAFAAVEGARSELQRAEIALDYAYVKAPISGRISRAEVTKGNFVDTGTSAPILTTIVSDEGIYADFDVDEQTYLHFVRNGAYTRGQEANIPVELTLAERTYEGTILAFDNRLSTATGTIRARAYFANKDQSLLPGMVVGVRMGTVGKQNHIMVSERAIGTDQDRKFVYVVGDDNKTAYREVAIGASVSGRRVILSGVEEGERIVSGGLARMRPDMPVAPQIKEEAAQPEIHAAPSEPKAVNDTAQTRDNPAASSDTPSDQAIHSVISQE